MEEKESGIRNEIEMTHFNVWTIIITTIYI